MQLSPYYRTYALAWETDPEEQRRFHRLMMIGLALLVLLGLLLPLIHLPRATEAMRSPCTNRSSLVSITTTVVRG